MESLKENHLFGYWCKFKAPKSDWATDFDQGIISEQVVIEVRGAQKVVQGEFGGKARGRTALDTVVTRCLQ